MENGKILLREIRHYPSSGFGVIATIYVLVAGAIGDYAAYVGHSANPEWVREHGNKICFAEAKAIFPSIEVEKYRL